MITIAMVHNPKDRCQHMWAINCAVFPIIREAFRQWPGVIAYRLTGQEKYYEPTWIPQNNEDEQLGTLQSDVELFIPEECSEDGTPQQQTLRVARENAPETTARKPLTFIDLKVQ